MNRYETLFASCQENKRIAFIPFVMLGDPSFEDSLDIIRTLIDAGADALELGIPFSDPVADGPVIQAAAIRALSNGMNTTKSLELINQIRNEFSDIPMGLLLYANLVYRPGIDVFYQRCAQAGVDSVLIADVPIRESQPFDKAAKEMSIDSVHILPPNVDDNVVQKVAEKSCGYTYVLGRAGVTGTDKVAQMPAQTTLNKLQQFGAPPAVLGFGVSLPKHVHEAKASGFQGVISGSATVKLIEQYQDDNVEMKKQLTEFVQRMVAET